MLKRHFTKFYKDKSPQEIDDMVIQSDNSVKDTLKVMKRNTDEENLMIKRSAAQAVEFNYNIMKAETPEEKQQMWDAKRSDMKDSITNAYKHGDKKLGRQLEEKIQKIPEEVPNDSQLTMNWQLSDNNLKRLDGYEKTKNKDNKLTFSQKKTHLREVRKAAKNILEEDYELDEKVKPKIIAEAVKIAQQDNQLTAEEALSKAKQKVIKLEKSVSRENKVSLKRGQVSNDGKKIFDGKKWVEYNKK